MATVETIEIEPHRESRLATLGFYARRYPLGAAGAVIVTAFVLMAIFAPWLVIFPGAAISLAVFGTNLLGDALRDILDPRQRD